MSRQSLTREKFTKIAIPKGELLPSFLQFLQGGSAEARPVGQSSLVFELPFLANPILLVAMRPRDIGRIIDDPTSDISFGITGSDIVWEQRLNPVEELPLATQKPSRLAFGFTPNLMEKVARPRLESLDTIAGAKVISPYPNITQEVLQQRGIQAEVREIAGATEAQWWADSLCLAILDVVVSGSTFAQNDITEADTVLDPITVHVVARATDQRLSPQKQQQRDRDATALEIFLDRAKKKNNRKTV